MSFPVQLLLEFRLEVSGNLASVAGTRHEPDSGTVILSEAHQIVACGSADVLVCGCISVANT